MPDRNYSFAMSTNKTRLKYEKVMRKSMEDLLKQRASQATKDVYAIVKERRWVEEWDPFVGYGCVEDWRFFYPKGPSEWLRKSIVEKDMLLNPIDLLNICYMVQLHEKRLKVDDVLNEYGQLESEPSFTYELAMGKAHVFYFDNNF